MASLVLMMMQSTSIETAARYERTLLLVLVAWTIISALVAGVLTYLLYRKTGQYQEAVQSVANARIADADRKAATANEGAAKANAEAAKANLEVGKTQASVLAAQTHLEQLQIAAANAKAAQQRVETELAKQTERTAKAEKELADVQERFRFRKLSQDDATVFIGFLKQHPVGEIEVVAVKNSEESEQFANQLRDVFLSGGWKARTIFGSTGRKGIKMTVRDLRHTHGDSIQEGLKGLGFFVDQAEDVTRRGDKVTLDVGLRP